MRKFALAVASFAIASVAATGAMAAPEISPDQRPLDQITFTHNAVFGYADDAQAQSEITPDKRALGEQGFHHETRAYYGGDIRPVADPSPDQRPLGR